MSNSSEPKKCDHSQTSNTTEALAGFIGHTVRGALVGEGKVTIIFECGHGLSWSTTHGGFWPESSENIKEFLCARKEKLTASVKELTRVLRLAGETVDETT